MSLSAEDSRRLGGLEGTRNFRDFGGYPTSDGALVRRGVLFRSNRLSQLTAGDVAAREPAPS